MVRKKAPYTYSLYSVSDSGQQSHILLPKRLKTRTIMSYMQLISNSSVYLIGNSNIRCVQVTCDPPLLNTILLLICCWVVKQENLSIFCFASYHFLGIGGNWQQTYVLRGSWENLMNFKRAKPVQTSLFVR